ncbi:MAG: FAD-dependent oxidoreductase, partial [Actinobacteria bacterium]|nr:FAD-dependent oxidoreductase [Actinomycetota bacterium]
RMAEADGETLLIVVGESHKVGEDDDTESRYRALEEWCAERFPIEGVRYRWSTQDYDSMDGLPFVGYAGGGNVLTATGFGGWGMTNGTAAALAIRDTIMARETDWADVYDVHRHHPLGAAGSFVGENAKVARHRIGDRISVGRIEPGDLRPGEAAVTIVDRDAVACFRDENGALHAVSATCTHLGCLVGWNGAERSWDCPCHGSRFGVDGEVIQAPATEPLTPVSIHGDSS